MTADQVHDILDFWFSQIPERWWKVDPAFDDEIRDRYLTLWKEERENLPEHFLGDPDTALAAVILFDQFPRNMFRGHADQYSTDPLALAVAKAAVERGFDDELEKLERVLLYMPFQHSERIADQDRAVMLFTALGNARSIDFARKHRDMIARYGRFPARNAALGRLNRAGEEAGISESKDW